MTEYLFTFSSITLAQSAQRVLQSRAIPVELRRTPKSIAANGCGYSLAVSERILYRALEAFRERRIIYRKLYRTQTGFSPEEVLP